VRAIRDERRSVEFKAEGEAGAEGPSEFVVGLYGAGLTQALEGGVLSVIIIISQFPSVVEGEVIGDVGKEAQFESPGVNGVPEGPETGFQEEAGAAEYQLFIGCIGETVEAGRHFTVEYDTGAMEACAESRGGEEVLSFKEATVGGQFKEGRNDGLPGDDGAHIDAIHHLAVKRKGCYFQVDSNGDVLWGYISIFCQEIIDPRIFGGIEYRADIEENRKGRVLFRAILCCLRKKSGRQQQGDQEQTKTAGHFSELNYQVRVYGEKSQIGQGSRGAVGARGGKKDCCGSCEIITD
jgi:hypothetical protein